MATSTTTRARTLLAAGAAAVLVASATACTGQAPQSKPAKTSAGVSGVVTSRSYGHVISPSRICTHKPQPAGCKPRWDLAIRSKGGQRHLLAVTKAAYSRCQLGDHYPTCVHSSS